MQSQCDRGYQTTGGQEMVKGSMNHSWVMKIAYKLTSEMAQHLRVLDDFPKETVRVPTSMQPLHNKLKLELHRIQYPLLTSTGI